MFVLRVLSELSLVLLVQDGGDAKQYKEKTDEKKERREKAQRAGEGIEDGTSCRQILSVITKSLLPRSVCGLLLSIVVFYQTQWLYYAVTFSTNQTDPYVMCQW